MKAIATGLVAAGLIIATTTSAVAAQETVRKPTAAEDRTLVPTVRGSLPSNWQSRIRVKTRISTVKDKNVWAGFTFGPRNPSDGSIQGGYGFARKVGSGWKIVDTGTSQVGCKDVPKAVIYDLLPQLIGFVERC